MAESRFDALLVGAKPAQRRLGLVIFVVVSIALRFP